MAQDTETNGAAPHIGACDARGGAIIFANRTQRLVFVGALAVTLLLAFVATGVF